jgi:hypothetical protein
VLQPAGVLGQMWLTRPQGFSFAVRRMRGGSEATARRRQGAAVPVSRSPVRRDEGAAHPARVELNDSPAVSRPNIPAWRMHCRNA